jgi:DNA-directed RNA polymerase specialized sigma24 family protein
MEWIKLRKKYLEEGWDEESIEKMYAYDLEEHKRYRSFCRFNQYFPESIIDDVEFGEDRCSLNAKFLEKMSIDFPEDVDSSRFGWIQSLDNKKYFDVINGLSANQMELLSKYVVDGMVRDEIAKEMGVSGSAITQQLNTIRKKFL